MENIVLNTIVLHYDKIQIKLTIKLFNIIDSVTLIPSSSETKVNEDEHF